jgi:hypothetical protein
MWKPIAAFAAALLASPACLASDLNPTEMRWLRGAWPVIAFARDENLPLDIVVQPQSNPGAAPLALAFVAGRCKLVLSMRGNAEAQATLARIEPDLLDATLELMAAHELGHCRRYLDGAWNGLPAGFNTSVPQELSSDLRTAYVNMKAARLEEGYGDLVGLAWAQQRHPQQYARLHSWLVTERSRDLLPGSHHDTLAWVRRAKDGGALAGPSIFAAAARLWAAALGVEE